MDQSVFGGWSNTGRKHKNKETVLSKVFGNGDKVGKGWAVGFILKVKQRRLH